MTWCSSPMDCSPSSHHVKFPPSDIAIAGISQYPHLYAPFVGLFWVSTARMTVGPCMRSYSRLLTSILLVDVCNSTWRTGKLSPAKAWLCTVSWILSVGLGLWIVQVEEHQKQLKPPALHEGAKVLEVKGQLLLQYDLHNYSCYWTEHCILCIVFTYVIWILVSVCPCCVYEHVNICTLVCACIGSNRQLCIHIIYR